jgi:nucleotide-binding universal stress UspA family protein
MTARVLVATDLSPISDEALKQGEAFARLSGAKLGVVHVLPNVQPVNTFFPQLNVADETDFAELTGKVRSVLEERIRTVTGRDHTTVDIFIDVGLDYAEVIRRAEEYKASEIVIASLGKTGLRRALLGSVAEKIIRYAHCPVLVVRPTEAKGVVVAATDMSDPSLPAIRAGAVEAERRKAKLLVVHAVDFRGASILGEIGSFFGGAQQAPDVAALSGAAKTLLVDAMGNLGVKGEVAILDGSASAAVCEYAEKVGAELVVVGTRGRTGLSRLTLGSTAESIVQHAPCSVLAVRQHE